MTIGLISYLLGDQEILEKIRMAARNFKTKYGYECEAVLIHPEIMKLIDLSKIDFPFTVRAYKSITSEYCYWAIMEDARFRELEEKNE